MENISAKVILKLNLYAFFNRLNTHADFEVDFTLIQEKTAFFCAISTSATRILTQAV
jgi:hypothetical protein